MGEKLYRYVFVMKLWNSLPDLAYGILVRVFNVRITMTLIQSLIVAVFFYSSIKRLACSVNLSSDDI